MSLPDSFHSSIYGVMDARSMAFKRRSSFLPLFSFFLLASSIFSLSLVTYLNAATYYVHTTIGQDNNDGLSETTTWKTIAKVNASIFSPGDQILFKRGEIWRETLVPPSSGALGHPIVFGAYGTGAQPILKGSNVVSNWQANVSFPYVWKALVTTEPKVLLFEGVRGQKKTSVSTLSSERDWFWDSNTLYVYATSNPDTLYISYGVEAMARNHGIYAFGKSHITIQDLNITGGNSYPIIFAWNGAGSNIIVQRCTASYGGNTGIWFVQNHATEKVINILVDSCTVFENGNSGICFDKGINTVTVSNNIVHHNNWASDWFHSGIKFFSAGVDAQNIIIERNESYSQYYGSGAGSLWATGSGIWLDTVADGPIIRYNYCHDNATIGILVEFTANADIFYNILTRNGTSTDVNWGDSGILLYRRKGGVRIYNNVVYGNIAGIALRGEDAAERGMVGNIVKNNISVGNTNEQLIVTYGAENDGTMGAGNVYTNNAFGPERSNFIRWGSASKATYAEFDSAYGSATHSIVGNPLFVNPTGTPADFRLLPTSPCIDAGTEVGLTLDRDGNGKYGAAWDIGAYEWKPSNSLSPPRNIRGRIIP